MKYMHASTGQFSMKQLSIDETVTEALDVIAIAKAITKNVIDNVSTDVQNELITAIKNLDSAEEYIAQIQHKADVALKFVPNDVQEKEFL